MKLTTEQLRQIIKEELNEMFRPTKKGMRAKRGYERMKAGMSPDDIRKLSDLEDSDNPEDNVSAYELANMMGSEEEYPFTPLKHKQMPLEYKAMVKIPKFVKGTVDGITQYPVRKRIEFWQNNGVDLDAYERNPAPLMDSWEPMHITKEQFIIDQQRFLKDHLYTTNDFYMRPDGSPDLDLFNATWMKIAPGFFKQIKSEIDKYIQSGEIREINGILYNQVPEHLR